MKHLVLAVALVLTLAAPALATHSRPSQAKQMKTSLVTAYDQCTVPGTVHQASLSAPACNPAVLSSSTNLANVTTFAPSGIAMMNVGAKVVPGDIKITVRGKLIHNNSAPYTGALTLALLVRITDHGCVPPIFPNPCTVVDLPLSVPVACSAGSCVATTTINTLIPSAIAVGNEMNIEIDQITVLDPDGDEAFRQGLFVP